MRYVAVDPKTLRYLRFDCLAMTSSRVWAWSGTESQARRLPKKFPLARDLRIEEERKHA